MGVGEIWIAGGGGELGVGKGAVVAFLRGGEETSGLVLGFGFSGVLKGDLNGWERVWDAVSMRRRFEGGRGDMVAGAA